MSNPILPHDFLVIAEIVKCDPITWQNASQDKKKELLQEIENFVAPQEQRQPAKVYFGDLPQNRLGQAFEDIESGKTKIAISKSIIDDKDSFIKALSSLAHESHHGYQFSCVLYGENEYHDKEQASLWKRNLAEGAYTNASAKVEGKNTILYPCAYFAQPLEASAREQGISVAEALSKKFSLEIPKHYSEKELNIKDAHSSQLQELKQEACRQREDIFSEHFAMIDPSDKGQLENRREILEKKVEAKNTEFEMKAEDLKREHAKELEEERALRKDNDPLSDIDIDDDLALSLSVTKEELDQTLEQERNRSAAIGNSEPELSRDKKLQL